ncbi:MAG: L,D-transpeptidase [Beijerinckiaceae bacterium]|jgi:lipoprotein-anchoring transpeptidase ErfK/SrfK
MAFTNAFRAACATTALALFCPGAAPVALAQESAAEFFSAPFHGPRAGFSLRPQQAAIPRRVVQFTTQYAPGTIVVSTQERRLYYVMGEGRAVQYGVGVGRPGFQWGGSQAITRKAEWPSWTPPAQMLKRRPDLPRFMKGGPDNPLGARALYLGSSLYRIHGSNEPETIGEAVSSGCIRMTNDDVVDLYDRVRVGTRVVVLR